MGPSNISAQILFENVTASSGMIHSGESFGVSWGDFNSDGWPDIWVNNHGKPSSLYLNQRDGTFLDIAEEVLNVDSWADAHGAAWGDFDNDGDQDLIQLVGADSGTGSGPNQLLKNMGVGFTDFAEELGVALPMGRGRTPLWFDWNRDGLLDLMISNTRRVDGQAPATLFTQTPEVFLDDTEYLEAFFSSPYYIQIIDPFSDGNLEILGAGFSSPDHIYSIDSIPFNDVSDAYNLPPRMYHVNDTAIADFNGDLLPDLFFARGNLSQSNYLQTEPASFKSVLTANGDEKGLQFRTTGDINIVLEPSWVISAGDIYIGAEGKQPLETSFALSPSDETTFGQFAHIPGVDRGLFIGYYPLEKLWSLVLSGPSWTSTNLIVTGTEILSGISTLGFAPSDGNEPGRMFVQSSGGTGDFIEQLDFGIPLAASSTVSGDFDNDMDIDLYVVNKGSIVNAANLLYENSGRGDFTIVPEAGGAEGTDLGQGDSVAVADYDQDGFLDLFITNGRGPVPYNQGPNQLFRNVGNLNHWLAIDLEGILSNRDGVGTTVIASSGNISQVRVQDGGIHSFSQNHDQLHFGLGPHLQADEISVRWPSGIVQKIYNMPADQIIRVIEPVTSNLKGTPMYQVGVDEGVFLWKDSFDGAYHLRTSGKGLSVEYTVKLISDQPIVDLVAYSLENDDDLEMLPNSFSLTSRIAAEDGDGLDFILQPGARALIAIEQNSAPNPRQIKVGSDWQPLTPAGWIVSSMDLPQRPNFMGNEDLGLFVGVGTGNNIIETRFNGDGLFHQAQFHLLSSVPILSVAGVGLELNDILTHTIYSLDMDAKISSWWDGVDLEISEDADIGITYEQDSLFQPHRVNPSVDGLGMPNAYWIPVATDGKPDFNSPTETGLFLWHDSEGLWHLRVTAGGNFSRYIGTIVADQEPISVSTNRIEGNDGVEITDVTNINFSLGAASSGQDGIDFSYPKGTNISLNLMSPSSAENHVFIGGEKWPVAQLPVQLNGSN